MNPLKHNIRIVIKYIIITILLLFSTYIVFNIIMGNWTRGWTRTAGTVTKCNHSFKTVHSRMDTPVGSYYRADDVGLFDFEYKYMAKNRIYHSKRISYPDTTIEDIEIASNHIIPYTVGLLRHDKVDVGTKIFVYYSEVVPSFSVLKKGYSFNIRNVLFPVILLIAYLLSTLELRLYLRKL